ncbi:hypothetical protein PAXRUDRAFT_46771, partial [Paxillus rubicundulus Ve08.2h10]
PQTLDTTHETVGGAATDTANPNVKSAGPTKPAGAPRTGSAREITEEVERASGSVTPSSNDDGGNEDVRHTYIVPKTTQPVPYCILPHHERR